MMANRATFAACAWSVNRERYARARETAYQGRTDLAATLSDETAVHELAFATLYLGDGAKTGGRVELASVRPDIQRYVLWVLQEVYSVDGARVTCRLHLIAAADHLEDQLNEWWMEQLGVPVKGSER
jgi:hypothetical protein